MTEVLWPPDLCPSSQTWTTIGNAATFNSPFSGTTRTYGRPGVRMGCTITLPPAKGENRARMLAVLRALKDRSNYIWVPDFTTTLKTGLPVRGSFPANEVFANNNFASGTTGWEAARCTLSVSDRVLRLTNAKTDGGAPFEVRQESLAVTQYAPYALRSMIASVSRPGMSNGTFFDGTNYAVDRAGLVVQSRVPLSATSSAIYPGVFDSSGTVALAGDYGELSWTSLARCFLVDNGPNALLRSDEFDNAAWTKSGTTVTANYYTAPDGTLTGDRLIEDTSTGEHYALQSVVRTATVAEWCFVIAMKGGDVGGLRNRARLRILDSAATNAISATFDLSGGVISSAAAATGSAANARAFMQAMGNGWYACCIVGQMPASDTTIRAVINLIENPNNSSYTGSGSRNIGVWRATLAQSSVPVRLTQTVAAATTGTTQTSNRLYVKGLPASTQNLLKAGDMVQIGGQINQLIAPLDSNAAGLGVLICGNPWRSPADNAPVIVNTPMCKMQLASDTIDIDTGPGQFSPFQIELVEAIE